MLSSLDPHFLETIGSMLHRLRPRIERMSSGIHPSSLHRGSFSFSEYEAYSKGHDIRHIDWSVFAKTDRLMVRRFDDAHSLRTWLVLDFSPSMHVPLSSPSLHLPPLSKAPFASTLGAALATLFISQHDPVGLLWATNHIFSPRLGAHHLHQLVDSLQNPIPSTSVAFISLLNTLSELRGPDSLLILISDFWDVDDSFLQILRSLRLRHSHIIAVHLVDPVEESLPYEGALSFADPESGCTRYLDVGAARTSYQLHLQHYLHSLEDRMAQEQIRYLRLSPRAGLEDALLDLVSHLLQLPLKELLAF